jgi:hypothetical protein
MEENKPQIGHETGDINVWSVSKVGIALAGVCVVTLGLMWGLFRVLQHEEPTPARTVNPTEIFPQPRLEVRPVQELRAFREAEDERLSTYGWVDQSKGVVHIPIERAIDIVAQRGLPARKESPAVTGAAAPTESGLGVPVQ